MRFHDDRKSSETDREYTVGYGRPPKHARFQPGQSGNLRGKPRGTLHPATVFKRTLLEKVVVRQSGRETEATKLHVFIMQTINKAVSGDYTSILLLLRFAGLGRELLAPSRKDGEGLSHETCEFIRRVLGGLDDEETHIIDDVASKLVPSVNKVAARQPEQKSRANGESIGYRNPPIHSRFQKGQSGNLAGRPRISKDFQSIAQRLLTERVAIVENGRRQILSRQDVIIKQMVNKALGGSPKFQALLFEYVPRAELRLREKAIPRKVAFERIRRSLLANDWSTV